MGGCRTVGILRMFHLCYIADVLCHLATKGYGECLYAATDAEDG